ncbi:MAG: dienelactone hydrolase [Chitinophagaceae bacterium]
MKKAIRFFGCIASLVFLFSCNNNSSSATTDEQKADTAKSIKEQAVRYKSDTTTLNGFISYNAASNDIRPAVLVVPEWWGINDYVRNRAKQLADMGYVAMAVDMYGNGKNAAKPQEAQAMAMPFYTNPQLMKTRLDAALQELKRLPQVDTSKIAAIGYCFGGSVVLNAAKLGADLKGVVSFHGSLEGVAPNKDLLKAKVLVCHGEADSSVPKEQLEKFKKQMDSVGASYSVKTYPNATHAFTNPASTETGKKFNMPISYNEKADKDSWEDMKSFFKSIF